VSRKVMYQIEISHPILHKHRLIKGEDKSVVERKARTQLAQWEAQRDRREEAYDRGQEKLRNIRAKEKLTNEREAKKALAIERTQDAQEEIDRLSKLLAHTLGIDDAIDWDSLKPNEKYSIKKPQKPSPAKIPAEPQLHDVKYQPKRSLVDYIFSSFWQRKLQSAKFLFASDHESWERVRTESLASGKHTEEEYRNGISEWEIGKRDFDTKQQEQGAAIERQRELYLSKSPEAITDYCDLVLSASQYPDYFPQEYWLSFDSENGQLIVDYLLPAAAAIPTLKQVKYVQTRDDFDEVHLRESELNSIYDALCYQVCLRTIHEIFEADRVDAVLSVVMNGIVRFVNPATGKQAESCIISLQANKSEFLKIDLGNVEPRACFKALKGVGSSKLHSMVSVAPIVSRPFDDVRIVEGLSVVQDIDGTSNLASMDWEEFEHLIREIFEKEFASSGGEVKVTRASRDGGVDAIAYDPDPIRGGKIVIQAKRYTNTVSVSAVRELYGTVVNEGATKGILVTTASFGPDAYEFAKGKPLTLLNGANLLHLLFKHGHRARINLSEARALFKAQS
jgi:restriction system protein